MSSDLNYVIIKALNDLIGDVTQDWHYAVNNYLHRQSRQHYDYLQDLIKVRDIWEAKV